MFDVVIKGGDIIDGMGNPPFTSDIGILGNKIETIQVLSAAQADKVINAEGLIVSPGFIDAHSHSDWTILADPVPDSTIRQGVTTEIVGNCGWSEAPVTAKNRNYTAKKIKAYGLGIDVNWRNFGDYLERVEEHGTPLNIACLVGHETIRRAVIGIEGRKGSKDELKKMVRLLTEALEAGAVGFSTGLEYPPGRSADLEELIELVDVVSKYNRIYTSHIRNRDELFEQSVKEQLQLSFSTGVNLQLSHLNVKRGASEASWSQGIRLVEKARKKGLNVTADCYPYEWGYGRMITLLPDWIFKDGLSQTLKRLQSSEVRNKLRGQCDRYWRFIHKGGWDQVTLGWSIKNADLIGKTFPEIAQIKGEDPWDCFFDILIDEGQNMTYLSMNGRYALSEEHVRAIMCHPLFMLASDSVAAKADSFTIFNHPNSYGWAPRILGYYVREVKLLSLEEAIRKMTSFPAQKFSIQDRGLLRKGMKADIVIFDAEKVKEEATCNDPNRYPSGINYVLVNGELTVEKGKYNGTKNGRVLRY